MLPFRIIFSDTSRLQVGVMSFHLLKDNAITLYDLLREESNSI